MIQTSDGRWLCWDCWSCLTGQTSHPGIHLCYSPDCECPDC